MHLIPSNISCMDYFEVLPLRKKQENRKQKDVPKDTLIINFVLLCSFSPTYSLLQSMSKK